MDTQAFWACMRRKIWSGDIYKVQLSSKAYNVANGTSGKKVALSHEPKAKANQIKPLAHGIRSDLVNLQLQSVAAGQSTKGHKQGILIQVVPIEFM